MFLIFIGQEKIRNVATCLLYTLIGSFEIKKEKEKTKRVTSFCICRCFPFGPSVPDFGWKFPHRPDYYSQRLFLSFSFFSDMGTSHWKSLAIGYTKAVSSFSRNDLPERRLYKAIIVRWLVCSYLLCLKTLCLGFFIQKNRNKRPKRKVFGWPWNDTFPRAIWGSP